MTTRIGLSVIPIGHYAAAMALSQITPTAVKVDKLISRVADGDIKIPAFQRRFVWDQEQIIELLDSMYRDYPIGSLLLWNSDEKLKATRNICGFCLPDRQDSYPVNYVLDGQQRLSTIYAVFCQDRTQAADTDEEIDLSIFDIVFDLGQKSFRPQNGADPKDKVFPLKSLFDLSSFIDIVKDLSNDDREIVKELHTKLNNYEIPVVTITKRSKAEVGTIFERINNTGTKLTTLDLMVAWTWSEDFHLQDQIKELLDVLDGKGFGELPEKTILQCLSAIIQESTSTKSILTLDAKVVHSTFDALTSSLEKTIDFLATQLQASYDFLPHVQQLVPLAFFFSKVNGPTSQQVQLIKQWFWKTSFSRRYSAQTDEKMDADISFYKQVIAGTGAEINKYSYSVTPEQLQKQKFTRNNPVVRAFLLLLAQNHPLDLSSAAKVDTGKALSEYNSKEYHHIFPRAYLKKNGVPVDKINSLCNFCFLSADSNKKISSKAPADYFATVMPQANRHEILESNLMPIDKNIYEMNDFDSFLKLRSQLVIQYLDKQLL